MSNTSSDPGSRTDRVQTQSSCNSPDRNKLGPRSVRSSPEIWPIRPTPGGLECYSTGPFNTVLATYARTTPFRAGSAPAASVDQRQINGPPRVRHLYGIGSSASARYCPNPNFASACADGAACGNAAAIIIKVRHLRASPTSPTAVRVWCIRCKTELEPFRNWQVNIATRKQSRSRGTHDMNRSVPATPGRTSTASTAGWMDSEQYGRVPSVLRTQPAPHRSLLNNRFARRLIAPTSMPASTR